MKTKLHSLLIGLASVAGVHPVLAQPALGIVPTNNQVILFWPITTSGTNGVLQSATSLVSPNWLSATDAFPVNYGPQIAVSVSNASSASFFRLSLVPPTADGMALIPAGSFTMGNSIGDSDITDAIPTNVYVSAFYMDTNLVSSNQWAGVYNYAIANGYRFDDVGSGKAANQPVQTVNWYDCVKWSNARSQQAGLTPVYYTDAGMTQVYTNGDTTNVFANWTANGYRLPTEAEWEKAARGGLSGQRFPWGLKISESQANYTGETNVYSYDLGPNGYNSIGYLGGSPYTSPVGSFAPNGYGLYDMAGNVWEWCWDWYGTPYGQPTTTNPTGPASGSNRVFRGGSWGFTASFTRCAYRVSGGYPNGVGSVVGFRCVRGLSNTPAGMAFIPAGSFTMGDTLDGESYAIPTNVYVSAFYVDTNLVSSNQWAGVYNYAVANGYSFDNAGSGKAANQPVETVDWYDCVKWCNARTQQADLTPVYYTDAGMTQVYTNGDTNAVYANWSANGYRLPTEAEWEKAARGGLSGLRFPWGNTISESQANYNSDYPDYSYDLGPYGYNSIGSIGGTSPATSPVGYFAANGYGLYDMAGNVEEWCWDWYGTPYGQPTTTNPTGPASGSARVLRGGNWFNSAYTARCAARYDYYPYVAYYYIGFRCVRGL